MTLGEGVEGVARLRDAMIIDEMSFLDERLGGNPLATLRNIFYFMGGSMIAYRLYTTGKPGLQLAGILVLLFTLALILYPKKSLTLERLLVGMVSYLLGLDTENVVRRPRPKTSAGRRQWRLPLPRREGRASRVEGVTGG